MASLATSIAIFLIVLAGASAALPTTYADASLIARTCKKTTNTLLCMDVLHVNPKSAYASTEHDIASVALQIVIDTADHNTRVINNLVMGSQGMPEGRALAICLYSYGDADNMLNINARAVFNGGDYVRAMGFVLRAKAVGDICENAFKMINKKSPVSNIDREMTKRGGVAGELIGLLVHK